MASNPWTVGHVFREYQEKLLIYGDYCSNLTVAQQELEDVIATNDTVRIHIQVSLYVCAFHQPEVFHIIF